MPVLAVEHDPDELTLTVTAFFAAPVEAVWDLYADPRKLERHWGPPGYPATFVQHRLEPGARSHYFMTGPDGEEPHGVWDVLTVDAPHRFEVADAFADAEGRPDEETGWNRMRAELRPADGGTRLVLVSTFASVEQLRQMLDMGMEEGLRAAMGQIDGLLAEGSASA